MPNWFTTREYYFKDILCANNRISSSGFLLASNDFITILDKQRSPVFIPIKNKFKADLEMIMTVVYKHPEHRVAYLDDILEVEKNINCNHSNCKHATRGIFMLARGFSFIERAFRNAITRDDMELNEMFQESYLNTLSEFHDPVAQQLFYAAMGMCPYKQVFFKQLQEGDTLEKTKRDASVYFSEFAQVKVLLARMCRSRGWAVKE